MAFSSILSKLIRCYHVSDAAVHDSQVVDELLMWVNTAFGVWADADYRSEDIEAELADQPHPLQGETGQASDRTGKEWLPSEILDPDPGLCLCGALWGFPLAVIGKTMASQLGHDIQ